MPHRTTTMVLAIAGMTLAAGAARADRLDHLGAYERQAVRRVLSTLDAEIDSEPDGKRIGSVRAVNLDVFLDEEGILTWLNAIHRTTRPEIIEREVLFEQGDVYEESLVRETERNLRDPSVSSLVVVVPVRSGDPDAVDLLVVTRDVLSLKLNLDFELQNDSLTRLRLVPTENNLFGWRKRVAWLFELDQGSLLTGPIYEDPNIAGSRLRLEAFAGIAFDRAEGGTEGSASRLRFEYPLWSLARPWGAFIDARHRSIVAREFTGSELMPYDPGTPDDPSDDVPWRYDLFEHETESGVVWQLGERAKHRITLGHQLHIRTASLPADFPDAPMVREAFSRDVLPRDERDSAVFARYQVFVPRFRIYRNVDTFEFPEERRVGPELVVELAGGPELLGSRRNFAGARAAVGWHQPVGSDGWAEVRVGGETRLEGEGFLDKETTGELEVASPTALGLGRVVGRARAVVRNEDSRNQVVLLGGETGLRGYEVGAFSGSDAVVANVELRALPIDVGFTRLGLLAFWDAGHAADDVDELSLHHDVGVGLRFLVPQLGTSVLRLDWAVPLNGATAGLPGRITLGSDQFF